VAADFPEILDSTGEFPMTRTRLMAGLFCAGLLASLVVGQPPAKPGEKKPVPKKPTFDEIIAASVRNDADVKIAEAEVQLATAKLNAVKVAAARKVTLAKEAIDQARGEVQTAKGTLQLVEVQLASESKVEEILKSARSSDVEIAAQQQKVTKAQIDVQNAKSALEAAMGKLSRLETDWNRLGELTQVTAGDVLAQVLVRSTSLTGPPTGAFHTVVSESPDAKPAAPVGLMAELRLALDKPIEAGIEKQTIIAEFMEHLLKQAGFQGRIKVPGLQSGYNFKQLNNLEIKTTTMPLGSWLQLIADEVSDLGEQRYDFYVRDYGLQLATKDTAAPGAIPLSEFWKTPKPDAPKK
jgi:hypothetical protein